MELKTITTFNQDGSVKFKQSANVFNVEDRGNGIARGQISIGRSPYGQADQALINAGYKLDQKGYIRGSLFVIFKGPAYQKALGLGNGTVIEDIVFDVNIFPYVNNQGQIKYRGIKRDDANYDQLGPQWSIIDFNVKQFGNGNAVAQPQQPQRQYASSPMYTQQPQQPVQQSTYEPGTSYIKDGVEYYTPEY